MSVKIYTQNFIYFIYYDVWSTIDCFFISALIDAGIGVAQINTILSAVNIPRVTGSLIQKYLELVAQAAANESCEKIF